MSTASAHEWITRSPRETEDLGARLGEQCRGGELLLISGELGAGKTVLVRGVARALGIDPRDVRSPSYTLLHRHRGTRVLDHCDVYFTEDPIDLARSGLIEHLDAGGVAAIEWGERFEASLPGDQVRIVLEILGPQERRICATATGRSAGALLERLRRAGPGARTPPP